MPMLIVDEKPEPIFYTYNSSTSSSTCLTRNSSSTKRSHILFHQSELLVEHPSLVFRD
jgi:hypothetical protein